MAYKSSKKVFLKTAKKSNNTVRYLNILHKKILSFPFLKYYKVHGNNISSSALEKSKFQVLSHIFNLKGKIRESGRILTTSLPIPFPILLVQLSTTSLRKIKCIGKQRHLRLSKSTD